MNSCIRLFLAGICLGGVGMAGAVEYTNSDFTAGNVPATITEDVIFNMDGTTTPTYSGVVSGTAAFTKTGSGMLILTGANRYSGTTTISEGTLRLGNAFTINNSNQTAVTIGASGTLDLAKQNAAGSMDGVGAITLNGGTLNASTSDYSNIGAVILNGGKITSTGALTGNAARHGYYLFGGTVNVTADSSITAGKFMVRHLANASVQGLWTVNEGVTLSISSQILLSDSDVSDRNLSTLTKLGAGTMLLTDTARIVTYTNASDKKPTLKVDEGKVVVSNADTLGNAITDIGENGTLEIVFGGVFDSMVRGNGTILGTSANRESINLGLNNFSQFTGTYRSQNGNGTVLSNGGNYSGTCMEMADGDTLALAQGENKTRIGMIIGNGTLRPSVTGSPAGVTLALGNDTEYANHTFSGIIADHSGGGRLAIEKVGTNTWTLSGNNTYTGGTTISGGVLKVTNMGALGSGTVAIANDGELDISAPSTGVAFTKAITGTGTLTASGKNWFNFQGSLEGFSGTFHVNTTGGMNLHSDSGDASNVCFVVSPSCDSLSLIDTGAGLRVGMITGGPSGGTNGSRPSGSSRTNTSLKVGNDIEYANHTWDGAFWENPGQILSIEKVGSNTWTWTSSNHSFKGGLTVSGGVLELASTANVRNSVVTVKKDGTLSNAGTVGQTITVEQGGTYEGLSGSKVSKVILQEGAILTGNAAFNAMTLELADRSILSFDLDILNEPGYEIMNLGNVLFPNEVLVDITAENFGEARTNLFSVNEDILSHLTFGSEWLAGYTDGNVWVQAVDPSGVPEPASWLLLLAAGVMGWRWQRRI